MWHYFKLGTLIHCHGGNTYSNLMENLIYARWTKPLEIESFINSIKEKNEKTYIKSLSYLNHHKYDIIKNYHLLDETYNKIITKNKAKREMLEKALINGNCTCGASVFYVEEYSRYFCEEYDNDYAYHFNFIGFEKYSDTIINEKCYLNTTRWVTELKHKSSLPKSVKISDLYKFIMSLGLPCLSEKNGGESVLTKLNDYMDAIKKGVHFEKDVKEILEKKYDTVYYHQGIKYQYESRRPRFAIPDFIVSTDDEIIIFECKVNESLKDDMQRHKYLTVVKFLMEEKNIIKNLSFQYVYLDENNKIVFENTNGL